MIRPSNAFGALLALVDSAGGEVLHAVRIGRDGAPKSSEPDIIKAKDH